MKDNKNLTPAMKQYWEAKKKCPNAILLFRMGDFYETFDKDAKIASNVLGIALTKRANGSAASVPLAGFPYHSLDKHLHKFLEYGYKVAICEQIENPKLSKGIVKRKIVEVVSPGATVSESYLKHNENNFLCSLHIKNNHFGMTLLDFSTGDFKVGELPSEKLNDYIANYQVKEILISKDQIDTLKKYIRIDKILITEIPDWNYSISDTYNTLINHFNLKNLKGYGIENYELAIISAGVCLDYVKTNYNNASLHIHSLGTIVDKNKMLIDEFTIKNLEIFNPISSNIKEATLISVIDSTCTSGGSRLLKQWIREPLISKKMISQRQQCVKELVKNHEFLSEVRLYLKEIVDCNRILSKLSLNKINPRDLLSLYKSLESIQKIKGVIKKKQYKGLNFFNKKIKNSNKIENLISKMIKEDPNVNINKGGFIKDGYSSKLDELRLISSNANNWLIEYQENLKKKLDISSLKISYNKIFGYYIEITKAHMNKIPNFFIRKQTLVNSERFYTEELKEFELKILNAQDNIVELENQYFEVLKKEVLGQINIINSNVSTISKIDIFACFAKNAIENNYVCPIMNYNSKIDLIESRHPVIESLLDVDSDFVTNDITIDKNNCQIAIITGPNMAGKSTFLRQIGLIVLLSQIGSFVPAQKAEIGIVDRIFTRVGASDNLALGESTFLVEMIEVANILNNCTDKSLILLDEVGRGTSTYDGLAIAWAIIEYIHDSDRKSKTLFATHYHELIDLAEKLNRGFNLNVLVKEHKDEIIFLHKIKKGSSNKSYAINVAKMAGIPNEVIRRSKFLLDKFTSNSNNGNSKLISKNLNNQLPLFNKLKNPIIEKIDNINIDEISPIEALNILNRLKNEIDKDLQQT